MKITIAHSPDSDDAFMFYGLAKGGVDTGDLEVSHVLTDIETLNRHAQEGRHEVTAISFHAYPFVADRYALMPCGGSIGDGYGPLLVAREARARSAIRGMTIAVPGTLTSAYLALTAVRARRRDARRAVRPDPRRGARGPRRGGARDPRGPAHLRRRGARQARRSRRVVEAGDGPAAAARRQRGAPRPRQRADGAAHAARARDGEALARAPAAGARVRDELRARHGPRCRRSLRRDVGERHDAGDGGARPASRAALPRSRLRGRRDPEARGVDFVEA